MKSRQYDDGTQVSGERSLSRTEALRTDRIACATDLLDLRKTRPSRSHMAWPGSVLILR